MPIFDYRCTECNNIHEYIVLSHEPAPTICPDCGKETLVKQMGHGDFRFQLKGECWSKDGYQYEYLKPKVGEEHVKPTYSRKKVKSIMNEIQNSRKPNKEEE